jgi:hypothetical protein
VQDIKTCNILFIGNSENERLDAILAAVKGRSTLTVSELEGAAQRGVMILFTTQQKHVRLRINVAAARASGLTISSNLLRPAEIVGGAGG